MTATERQQYWQELWKLYYSVYFHELVDATVGNRLSWAVKISDFVFGATASGSAIAAWAVWNEAAFQPVWGALSGAAGFLAIVMPIIGIRDLAKNYSASLILARRLRLRIEFYRAELNIREDWDKAALLSKLNGFQGQYEEFILQRPADSFFETKAVVESCQKRLNVILKDELAA